MKAALKIIFLSVPESLRGHVDDSFSIDPDIPLPVEVPENFSMDELSWEMIIAGMLRIIADGSKEECADYYRRFVLAVRPGIMNEFTEAAILKARNGDFDLALECSLPRPSYCLTGRLLWKNGHYCWNGAVMLPWKLRFRKARFPLKTRR